MICGQGQRVSTEFHRVSTDFLFIIFHHHESLLHFVKIKITEALHFLVLTRMVSLTDEFFGGFVVGDAGLNQQQSAASSRVTLASKS